MSDGGKIAAIFILSLFFSTFFIAYFEQGFLGTSEVEVINLPTSIDGFTLNNNFDNTTCPLSDYTVSGSWFCDDSGVTSTGAGSLIVPLNVRSQDGKYKSTYHIVRHDGEYTIIITDTKYGSYIHLQVKNDGLYIPNVDQFVGIGHWETNTAWFQPLDGTVQDVEISTEFNINSNELTIVFNGQSFQPTGIPSNSLFPSEVIATAGIQSDSILTVKSIDSTFLSNPTDTAKTLDGLAMVVNLAWSMLLLASYQFPYDILPLEVQVATILPQEFMICVGVAIFLRSG